MLHISFEMVVAFRSSGPRPEQRRCTLGGRLTVGSKYDFRGSWLRILRGMGKHDRESKAVVVITYALVGHTQTHVHNLSHDTHACARPDAMWLPLVSDILEAPAPAQVKAPTAWR